MRLFRFLIKLLPAVVAVGLTFVIIFFLTPSWQQSVITGLLAEDTQRQWQVNGIELSPFGIEAAGVFVLQEGAGAEIRQLSLAGPIWQVLFTRSLRIDSGEIRGLVLDVTEVQVGDTSTSDWQSFLDRVSSDTEFWEERIGLLLRKAGGSGWDVNAENLAISGMVLLPGNELVPLELMVLQADSTSPESVHVERLQERGEQML